MSTVLSTPTRTFEERAPAVPASGLIGPNGSQAELGAHLAAHGRLPDLSPRQIIELASGSGLTGHGGAGFPLWRKLQAVADAGRRPIVVANGAEGEPASAKDRWLLANRPHLVLDGLQLAARAVGAREAVLYAGERQPLHQLEQILRQRRGSLRHGGERVPVDLVSAPEAFISGEESAVVNYLTSGYVLPRLKIPRVTERGVRGRPTLVSNVETLALLALIARRGAAWFRASGTADEPGTMLCTVTGAVQRPGIVEVAYGTPLVDVVAAAGGPTTPPAAVLLGGYHGSWLTAAEASGARLSRADLAALGASPGAGVVVVLPEGTCGLAEVSRVMTYLARESAGQCGPCLNGLPRIAEHVRSLAVSGRDHRAVEELQRLSGVVAGRGVCHHPDGSVRFLRGALRVFADEVRLHRSGRCSARAALGAAPWVLPVPGRRV